jgi:hypothetical protein
MRLSSRALNSHTGIALSSVNKAAFIPLPKLRSATSIFRHAALSRTYVNELDCSGTLTARALKGLRANRLRLVRSVATVIGISLSMAMPLDVQANTMPTKSMKVLANKQLTDKQYKCHNEIIYRESRWQIDAIGNKAGTKQTHGYYQIKSESIKGKPYDYQFWIYWDYVSSRYGITQYDEPNYCLALHHLKTKGWQ